MTLYIIIGVMGVIALIAAVLLVGYTLIIYALGIVSRVDGLFEATIFGKHIKKEKKQLITVNKWLMHPWES